MPTVVEAPRTDEHNRRVGCRTYVVGAAVAAFALPATTAASPTAGSKKVVDPRARAAERAPSQEGDKYGCHEVKLISVRGSGDTSSNMGKLGAPISSALQRKATALGIDYDRYGLEYPAVGIDWWKLIPGTPSVVLAAQYALSKKRGRDNLRAEIKAQCQKEKIVLIGFSQGSHVIGDVLSKKVGGLAPAERARIKAVVLVADPRFNSREKFDAATGFNPARHGILGARSPGDLGDVSRRTMAWCRKKDLVCQGLPNPLLGIHKETAYRHLYGGQIVAFISSRLGWKAPTPPPPSQPVLNAGDYSGSVDQNDGASFTVTIHLNKPPNAGGTLQIPEGSCDGTLTFTAREASSYRFRLDFPPEQDGCISGGTVTLTPVNADPKTPIRYEWTGAYPDGTPASSSGTLYPYG
jgi:Cutinase